LENKPLVTIVTVCYNSEKTIKDTIESVLNQTYTNIEYILVDGASKDSTVDIIKSYEEKFKEKGIIYKWISEPDKGIYDAMNKGIDMANGEWLYFLGSDDRLIISIEILEKKYFNNPSTIYYGDVYMPKRHKLYNGKFTKWKISISNICHQAIFYNKISLKKYKYNLDYSVYADHELNINCFADEAIHFKYMPYLISIFNDETGFSSKNKDINFKRILPKLILKKLGIQYYLYYKIRKIISFIKKGIFYIKNKIIN
jgi:glycosyltransferase involved in cell wall biosynthesis